MRRQRIVKRNVHPKWRCPCFVLTWGVTVNCPWGCHWREYLGKKLHWNWNICQSLIREYSLNDTTRQHRTRQNMAAENCGCNWRGVYLSSDTPRQHKTASQLILCHGCYKRGILFQTATPAYNSRSKQPLVRLMRRKDLIRASMICSSFYPTMALIWRVLSLC